MSCRWRNLCNTKILSVVIIPLFAGCYQTLPPSWQGEVPGIYEGGRSGFREVVEFRTGGIVHHEVYDGEVMIVKESSKWSVSQGSYSITVDSFTQFYDPTTRKFSSAGAAFVGYEYLPLPDGKTFTKISASVDFDFCLIRKKVDKSK